MNSLFAYGTLQIPEVMSAVTGLQLSFRFARLEGFSRHCLRGKTYPGIRPNLGHCVNGALFEGVDESGIRLLDEFEDTFYERKAVTVSLLDGGECPTQAYIIKEEAYGLLLAVDWDLEAFREKDLPAFIQSHRPTRG